MEKFVLKVSKYGVFMFLLMIIGCTESEDDNPNIVFIISDDQSWSDYSFMEHPQIETPNIDNLASEGLTFTRGYLPAPVCRPSLASLATGLYPHQHGVTGNDPGFEFDRDEGERSEWLQARLPINNVVTERFNSLPSLPKLLKQEGYISLQTGKWWEGSWQDGGFTDGMTHGDPTRGGRHGDEGLSIGREGMQPIEGFLDKAETENKPFFLWYAPFLPHTPHTPPDSLLNKYKEKASSESIAKYWAMVEWFDITVGQLLDSLDERGLTENTMIVYVTDNGWIQNPNGKGFEWRSKQSPYDMGIRTPITYKWPGKISARMDTTAFVSSLDIVPTVLNAVGIETTSEMKGVNVLDSEELESRTAVFSEDYNHDIADVNNPTKSLEHRVIIKKPWKLIVPKESGHPQKVNNSGGGEYISMIREPELYHIIDDPYEEQNIASEHPEIVNELQQRLDEWWQANQQ